MYTAGFGPSFVLTPPGWDEKIQRNRRIDSLAVKVAGPFLAAYASCFSRDSPQGGSTDVAHAPPCFTARSRRSRNPARRAAVARADALLRSRQLTPGRLLYRDQQRHLLRPRFRDR